MILRKIDNKGRLTVPRDFREEIDSNYFIVKKKNDKVIFSPIDKEKLEEEI